MNNPPYKIIPPVSAEDFQRYYQFRWALLRQPLKLPKGSEQDAAEARAFHCMAVAADQSILGVGRIHFTDRLHMRIRYLAVHADHRRQGVGSAITARLIDWARQHQAKKCWLKARSSAVPFYLQQGFVLIEQTRSELQLEHFLMEMPI